MSVLDKQFVFVIGAPRSGTSWLHQMLAAHPQVAAMPSEELTIFSRYVHMWVDNYTNEAANMAAGRWRQGLPCLWSEAELHADLLRFIADVYGRVLRNNPAATHVLDKHPNYSNHLPTIDRFLPHARYVHILRDGREVAVSMMSVRKRVGHSPGEIRGAAHEWHRHITNARTHGRNVAQGRYLEVRYEELGKDTSVQLARVLEFCGLAPDPALVERLSAEHHISVRQVSTGDTALNALRDKPGAIWKERLGLRERYILDRMVGGLLHELGYAGPGWWALGPGDRSRMLPYGIAVRVKRTAAALRRIWSGPVEEHLA